MTLEVGMVLKRVYSCKGCSRDILLQVKDIASDGKPSWTQLETSGSIHTCKKTDTTAIIAAQDQVKDNHTSSGAPDVSITAKLTGIDDRLRRTELLLVEVLKLTKQQANNKNA
jgi:hypothetical protein